MKVFKINSIFARLFLTFILVLIPIFITGILIYDWGEKAVKNKIQNTAQANVSFIKETLEWEFQRVKKLQYDMLSDKSLNRAIPNFFGEPEYIVYPLIDNVQSRVIITKESSSLIQDVVIHSPYIKKSISAVKGFNNINTERYDKIMEHRDAFILPLIKSEIGLFTAVAYPTEAIFKKTEPQYIIEVSFSDSQIAKMISKFNKFEKEGTILFNEKGKIIVSANIPNDWGVDQKELYAFFKLGNKDFSGLYSIKGVDYLLTVKWSEYLGIGIMEIVQADYIFKTPDRYRMLLWIYLALTIIFVAIFSFSTYRFVHHPIQKILKAFKKLEKGDLNVNVDAKGSKEFLYLFQGFNKMVHKLNELIDRVYRQELYARNAEIKQLQTQINPHFLYNTFFYLNRSIKREDYENAREMAEYLGSYFKYITRNTHDEVYLYQELEHVINYCEIQMIRFDGRLKIEIQKLEDKYKNIKIPRLILQPIVENAIEHGMKDTISKGLVKVSFERSQNMGSEDMFCICVEDNGESLTDDMLIQLQKSLENVSEENEITGLINVHRRISLKYGGQSGISAERSFLGGLKVVINIQEALDNPNLKEGTDLYV